MDSELRPKLRDGGPSLSDEHAVVSVATGPPQTTERSHAQRYSPMPCPYASARYRKNRGTDRSETDTMGRVKIALCASRP